VRAGLAEGLAGECHGDSWRGRIAKRASCGECRAALPP
jgi:hypothetical protein